MKLDFDKTWQDDRMISDSMISVGRLLFSSVFLGG